MEVVQLIGALLDAGFRELKLQKVESVIRAVRTWLREQETSVYREGMHALVSRSRKAVDVDTDYMEK
jgi:23S rRNA maturation mini-RNase III